MEMTRKLFNMIQEDMDFGEDENILRDDYSGRFMYGQRCLAFTCTPPQFYAELYRIRQEYDLDEDVAEEIDEFFEDVPDMCCDSLGTGTIFYFPRVSVREEEEDDE